MGNGAAITALTQRARGAPKLIRLTIPEGPSRREIAPRRRAAGVEGDYVKASQRSPRLSPRDYGAPKGASLEGFLFPATYELRAGATARSLVAQQVEAFKDNFATIDLRRAKRKNLTRYDVLMIASMIERETALAARAPARSPRVIYNRLQAGHAARHRRDDALRREQLDAAADAESSSRRDSPYNTRTRQGLPPTPIGNPGLASMQAAAQPAKAGYLYYVVKPCGNGAHAFSRTEAQFQKDVAAYNAQARRARRQGPVAVLIAQLRARSPGSRA